MQASIRASISFDVVLTAALCVVIALGTAVPASAFLTTYQSVRVKYPLAWFFIFSLCLVFKPGVVSPSTVTSANALAVALP